MRNSSLGEKNLSRDNAGRVKITALTQYDVRDDKPLSVTDHDGIQTQWKQTRTILRAVQKHPSEVKQNKTFSTQSTQM